MTTSMPRILNRLQALVLGGNLAWTVLCLGGYRPETQMVSAFLIAVLMSLHGAGWLFSARNATTRPSTWGYLLLPFLAYAGWQVFFHSPTRWLGERELFLWLQMAAVFWVVVNQPKDDEVPRRIVIGCMLATLLASVAMAVYQRWSDGSWLMLGRTQATQYAGRSSGSFGIPNSLAAWLVLFLFPLVSVALDATASWTKRICSGYLAGVCALGVWLSVSRGVWLAIIMALWVAPWLIHRGSIWRRMSWSMAVIVAAAGAMLLAYFGSETVRMRADQLLRDRGEWTRWHMWRGAWEIYGENPVLGSGVGSYNALFEAHRREGYRDEPQWVHNDYLNTLSDLGTVGFLLSFGVGGAVFIWGCRRLRAGDLRIECGLAVGLAAFGLTLITDFHLKIPGTALTAVLVYADWIRRRSTDRPVNRGFRGRQIVAGCAALGCAAVLLVWTVPALRAESLRYSARQSIDKMARSGDRHPEAGVFEAALADLRLATLVDPGNAQAWADRAYASSLVSRQAPDRKMELTEESLAASANALAGSEVVAEFWMRRGVALDMAGEWGEAGRAFAKALTLAPRSPQAWYYQGYHYGLRVATRRHALSALATCLRLDPDFREAESLRKQLATSSFNS